MHVTGQSRHPVVTQRARPSPLRTPSTPLSTPTSITSSSCRTVPNRRKGSSDIKTELEENTVLKEDFGELEGKVWKSSVILLSNSVKIEAIGSGKKIRGRRHKQWRPDLIVCDDLENDENVNTPEQRKKLRDWFYKAVSKAGDTYTDIVYIGTLLHFRRAACQCGEEPKLQVGQVSGRH